jgi:hypothetical protein
MSYKVRLSYTTPSVPLLNQEGDAEGRGRFWIGALLLLACCLMPLLAEAHVIPYDLKKLSRTDAALIYLKLGFTHILPNGFDHILFVLGLFLLNPKLKSVISQATAFTVAHSITLGLAMKGIITPISSIIEPIIALSIVFVAVENMFTSKLKPWRIVLVFLFGLIHGMGFASALKELSLPQTGFITSVLMFNIGVELGQITVILAAYAAVGYWFSHKDWYRKRIVLPASTLIALVAFWWTIERVFFVS